MVLPRIFYSFFTISAGVAIAQLLSFLITPVLSRFYSAESFGILGVFISVGSMLGSLASLQYGVALMLPKKNAEAFNIFALGCLSVFCFATIVSLVIIIFLDTSREILKTSSVFVLILLPSFVFFNGINQMLVGWSIRRKHFKNNAISHVGRSLVMNSFQIFCAPFFSTGGSLTCGVVLGEIASCVNLGLKFWKNEIKFFKKCVSINWMKKLAVRYYDFPIYSAPQNLINSASQGLPVLILGYFYGLEVAGLYAFAIRLIQAPLSLLLTPLRQVLFQRLCEMQKSGKSMLQFYKKCTVWLFAVIIIPSLSLMCFMPSLFSWIFGDNWQQAGEFARWLLFWHSALFCNIPSVIMARIIRMQQSMLFFDILVIFLRITTLVFSGLFFSASVSVVLFGFLGFILNVLLICWVWIEVKKFDEKCMSQ